MLPSVIQKRPDVWSRDALARSKRASFGNKTGLGAMHQLKTMSGAGGLGALKMTGTPKPGSPACKSCLNDAVNGHVAKV